jgi:hypothetical protein
MSATEELQNLVFRGLLLESTFDELEAIGVRTGGGQEEDQEDGSIALEDFSASIRIQALKMSSVYQAFFCFENSVRELVEDRLSESLGKDWWVLATSVELRRKVEDRKKKETANRWHGPRAESFIAYADFGDLSRIITNRWSLFEDLFPDQDWVRTRLSDLELSRNVIAHNGVLNGREITRITLYLKDWVMQVG